MPRLLMSWIATEAVRSKNRELSLGNTLTQFMEAVGVGPATGGRHGSITRLREQMMRLFAAKISYQYGAKNARLGENIQIARKHCLCWDDRQPNQRALFNSFVVLEYDFLREVTDRPVPVDVRALKLLKQSPMALDLYTWLTYRMSYLEKPTAIPWTVLARQ